MWFSKKPKNEPASVFLGLREQALTVTPDALGIALPKTGSDVCAVLMETGYAQAVATLVAFSDGSTSLYFSNGGGIIGGGGHESVRAANKLLIAAAQANLAAFAPAIQTPLPPVGVVKFYVRTSAVVLTAEAAEQELGEGRHPLSPLFYAGHNVIAAVRQAAPQS